MNESDIIEKAKEFVKNYIAQDNRCTAWPYAYVVQERRDNIVPTDCGDEHAYRFPDDDDHETFRESDIETLEKEFRKEYGRGWKIDLDECEIIGDFQENWVDVQWFFTEQHAQNYIANDKHNLGKTRTYVKHFAKDIEAETILRCMFFLAGENYDEVKR